MKRALWAAATAAILLVSNASTEADAASLNVRVTDDGVNTRVSFTGNLDLSLLLGFGSGVNGSPVLRSDQFIGTLDFAAGEFAPAFNTLLLTDAGALPPPDVTFAISAISSTGDFVRLGSRDSFGLTNFTLQISDSVSVLDTDYTFDSSALYAGTLESIGLARFNGSFDIVDGDGFSAGQLNVQIGAIPLPAPAGLLIAGLFGLYAVRRRTS